MTEWARMPTSAVFRLKRGPTIHVRGIATSSYLPSNSPGWTGHCGLGGDQRKGFRYDGLWFTLISLTLAGVFGGILAWSFYTGEGQQLLHHFRKVPASKAGPEKARRIPHDPLPFQR